MGCKMKKTKKIHLLSLFYGLLISILVFTSCDYEYFEEEEKINYLTYPYFYEKGENFNIYLARAYSYNKSDTEFTIPLYANVKIFGKYDTLYVIWKSEYGSIMPKSDDSFIAYWNPDETKTINKIEATLYADEKSYNSMLVLTLEKKDTLITVTPY